MLYTLYIVGKNGLGLGGEHTSTDEMGAVRKLPSSDAVQHFIQYFIQP
jgi:hypothetical protein